MELLFRHQFPLLPDALLDRIFLCDVQRCLKDALSLLETHNISLVKLESQLMSHNSNRKPTSYNYCLETIQATISVLLSRIQSNKVPYRAYDHILANIGQSGSTSSGAASVPLNLHPSNLTTLNATHAPLQSSSPTNLPHQPPPARSLVELFPATFADFSVYKGNSTASASAHTLDKYHSMPSKHLDRSLTAHHHQTFQSSSTSPSISLQSSATFSSSSTSSLANSKQFQGFSSPQVPPSSSLRPQHFEHFPHQNQRHPNHPQPSLGLSPTSFSSASSSQPFPTSSLSSQARMPLAAPMAVFGSGASPSAASPSSTASFPSTASFASDGHHNPLRASSSTSKSVATLRPNQCPHEHSGYCRSRNLAFSKKCTFEDHTVEREMAPAMLEVLEHRSEEFVTIERDFKANWRHSKSTVTVTKIEKVTCNAQLEEAFKATKLSMERRNIMSSQRQLYHGTHADNINNVLKTGFQPPSDYVIHPECPTWGHYHDKGLLTSPCLSDCAHCAKPPHSKRHVWNKCHMYGLGIYFADQSSKSDIYVRPKDMTTGKRMLLVDVLLGDPHHADYLPKEDAYHDLVIAPDGKDSIIAIGTPNATAQRQVANNECT